MVFCNRLTPMKNPVRKKLREGKVSLGGWLNLASPLAAEIMGCCGYDWLTLDAEHAACDLVSASEIFRAIEARGCTPLVRCWDHRPDTLARLLDAGAYGIIVPHTSTVAEAEAIVDSMRYPPVGSRSAGAGRIMAMGSDYEATCNEEILVIPQIEDPEGVENADGIMAVEGVDLCFLGPNDLSKSMGVEQGHPDHEAAVQHVLAACKKHGKPAGMPVRTTEAISQRVNDGFQLLDIASDLRLLLSASEAIVGTAEAIVADVG